MASTAGELAYVSNSYADTMSVIDTATWKVVDTVRFDYGEETDVPHWTGEVISTEEMPDFSAIETLKLKNTPMNPTFTIDGSRLWVANPVGRNIAIVDPSTRAIESTIDLDMQPCDIRFTPDGKKAVVSLLGDTPRKPGAVTVIDCATHKAAEPIQVGTQPEELELSADGKKAFSVSKSLWVIDVEAMDVITETYLPYWCYDSALAPDGKRLFLTSTFGSDKIVVIDAETNAVAGTIDVYMPCGMDFSGDGSRMFVTNTYRGSLQVVDLSTDEVVGEGELPPFPSVIKLTGAGDRALVCHPAGNIVSVLDTDSLEVVEKIDVDLGPCAIAVGPAE